MSLEVKIVLSLLILWLVISAWCGYKAYVRQFLLVLIVGLALDTVWMIYGLKASLFSEHMLMALAAGLLYTLSAFGAGWIVGRFVRAWRDSRVDAS